MLETIIRPFQKQGVEPVPFAKAYQPGSPLVEVKVQSGKTTGNRTPPPRTYSMTGGGSWSVSVNLSFHISRRHKELPEISQFKQVGAG